MPASCLCCYGWFPVGGTVLGTLFHNFIFLWKKGCGPSLSCGGADAEEGGSAGVNSGLGGFSVRVRQEQRQGLSAAVLGVCAVKRHVNIQKTAACDIARRRNRHM